METENQAVLISIKPKWCELILRGKKTVEVRKSRPKIKTPFKCYIYQSKGRDRLIEIIKDGDLNYGEIYHGKPVFIKTGGYESGYKGLFGRKQKIVGEFVCDFYETIGFVNTGEKLEGEDLVSEYMLKDACLTLQQGFDYAKGSRIYGWHISDLVIYGKPKELSEFEGLRKTKFGYEPVEIKRPPQSWCYVEECEENEM